MIYGYIRSKRVDNRSFQDQYERITAFAKGEVSLYFDVLQKEKGRRELGELLDQMTTGDTLIITNLSVLAPRKKEIAIQLCRIIQLKVVLIVLDIPSTVINSANPNVLSVIYDTILAIYEDLAEKERELRKDNFRPKSKQPYPYPANWEQVYGAYKNGKINYKEAALQLGCSQRNFYKIRDRYIRELNKD